MSGFFIGIDGGGTGCRAAIADANGLVLGEGRSGAANIVTDMDGAVHHVMEAAVRGFEAAGIDPLELSQSSAVLGLAGANLDTTVSAVQVRMPFAQCSVETDALIAAHGALADRDGAVAILGTGSVFARKRGDTVHTIGGWGFVVGDQGAGATLGRSLLYEALLAHDRVRPGSEVTSRVLSEFGNDPKAVSAFAQAATPGDFARYAPIIFDAASADDPVALRILTRAAAEVDEMLRVVLDGSDRRLCLLGGLGRLYENWLAEEHQRCVVPPVGDALAGATQLAVRRYGGYGAAHG